MGIARLVLAGLAVLTTVAMVVIGGLSLTGSLGPDPRRPAPSAAVTTPSAASPSAERVPTILVRCPRQRCPTVFLRVTGGNVLLNREMVKDEQVRFFDPKIDVVLADSAAVRVEVNGEARAPGEPGERQEFTAVRG